MLQYNVPGEKWGHLETLSEHIEAPSLTDLTYHIIVCVWGVFEDFKQNITYHRAYNHMIIHMKLESDSTGGR